MANWSNPTLTSLYTNFLTELKARDEDLAKQFDGQTVSNLVTGAIRWNSTINRWQKWSGSAWAELATTYALTGLSTTGNASIGGTLAVTGTTALAAATATTPATADNSTAVATTAYVRAQGYAGLASPAFTGTPTAPTAALNTNTTQVATTAFVINQAADATPLMAGTAAVGSSLEFARGDHVHPTDTSRAPLASPTFTGTPAAPTAAVGTNTTQLATTAFVQAEIANDAPLKDGTGATGTWGINISGSAATLTTPRTIWGQSFNGSANITGNLTAVGNITGSGAVVLASGGTDQPVTINTSGTGSIILDPGTTGGTLQLRGGTNGTRIYNAASTQFTQINAQALSATRTLTLANADTTLVGGTMVPTTGSGATGTWGINVSGNAATATALATARTINGVAFDGTANITISTASANSVTFNNGGAGGASGSTFNGGTALTVSYNTIGAPSTTGTNASGTWGISITGNAGTATSATSATTATNCSRQVIAGNGLSGGGALSADVTLTVGAGDGISVAATSVAVNSTVIRTTGDQTLGGNKTFSSPILAAAGSITTPGVASSGDTNTGLWWESADKLTVVAGGARAAYFNATEQFNYGAIYITTADDVAADATTTTRDSGALYFRGKYWNGSTSANADWRIYNDMNGTGPNGVLRFTWLGTSKVAFDETGLVSATTFSGSGASLTSLNASNISSGTIGDAYLPASITSNITGNAATATTASACSGNAASATLVSTVTNATGTGSFYIPMVNSNVAGNRQLQINTAGFGALGFNAATSTILGNISGESGSCIGNSATATKLSSSRTFQLTGDLSGSVNADLSTGFTISAQVSDNSHNHSTSTITDVTSGSYTPTLTNTTNISASSVGSSDFQYQRVGNIVSVCGTVSLTPTSTTADFSLRITLPIAPASFGNATQAHGVGGDASNVVNGRVASVGSTTVVAFNGRATTTVTSRTCGLSFSYRI